MQLALGYYGTHYDNDDTALDISGGAVAAFTPIALSPDNQSHQGYVSGSYTFSPSTVGNFKVAYGRATQDDSFILPSAPGNNDLDGRIDTTTVALGLRSRPAPRLTLRANLRYEDRDDKTPVMVYQTGTGAGSTTNGQNEPRSITTTAGKLEASYRLPRDFRLTGSIDYDEKERNETPIRVVSHRDKTDELTYRAELRRGLSETLNGALSLIHSKRDGSAFETTVLTGGAPYSNEIAPTNLADRDRDQVRLALDWAPLELLSIQFVADHSWDDYDQRTVNQLGPLEGSAQHYAVDASYAFSEGVQATAWYAHDRAEVEQAADDDASAAVNRWRAQLRDTGDTIGVGFNASPHDRLELGADLQYAEHESEYDQIVGSAIPDVDYRLTTLNLYTKYRLKHNSGVRLDYIYERMKTNDWLWANWTYTDGTTLSEDPRQAVHFVGLSYYYKFR